jgi:SpoVK/Ycf46/Vps4 family AAA+-type ATPase
VGGRGCDFDIIPRMTVSRDVFERYKQKGLDARRGGQWESARIYLLEAARAMTELSRAAQTTELRQAREEMTARLLELARDCRSARDEKRPPRRVAAPAEEPGETRTSAGQWLVKERPKVRLQDVAGLEDVKQEIRLKMIYPFEHADLAAKFGIRPGGGVLLYGAPGTGKTMLARAVAGEIDAAFYHVSAADLLSKWVGQAEQNIQALFASAASQPRSIIFIDEIESLIPARRDDGSSVMQRVVPQILQGMEGFDKSDKQSILFMGATNVPWQLDPAVLRPGRFDEKIYIPLPDETARRQMLEMYLANRPVAADVNLDVLARELEGYSGADIKHICDRSAVVPFLNSIAGEEEQISGEILQTTARQTPRSVSGEMLKRLNEWDVGE